MLTTSSGYVVQPQITIPNDATGINISNSGIVSVTVPGNDFGQEVGQISLVNFSNPRGLTPIGENFLVESSKVVSRKLAHRWMVDLEKCFKGTLKVQT